MTDSEEQDSWGLVLIVIISTVVSCVLTVLCASRRTSAQREAKPQQDGSIAALQSAVPKRDPYNVEPRQG